MDHRDVDAQKRLLRERERMRSYVEANQEIGRLHVHSLTGSGPGAEPDPESDLEALTVLIERAVGGPELPRYDLDQL